MYTFGSDRSMLPGIVLALGKAVASEALDSLRLFPFPQA
jgi:hypothetical protein